MLDGVQKMLKWVALARSTSSCPAVPGFAHRGSDVRSVHLLFDSDAT
jgi:hypothetical protein